VRPASARAAVDTTPPVWRKAPSTSIPLGATLTTVPDGCDGTQMWSSLPVVIDWRASDAESGISYYWAGGEHADSESTATRMQWTAFEDDNSCGGGSMAVQFAAVNGAGLESPVAWWRAKRLGVIDDRSATDVTYSGTWGVSSCACWSEGTTHKTTAAGAAMEVVVPSPFYNDGFNEITGTAYGLGLVMAKGPDRGKATVYVDGTQVAVVDTYSATAVNRTVVWRQAVTGASHTVRVVNQATAGRQRIDVDAVVMVTKDSVIQ
jgi:hypothetical protein